ncbi:hypothetical protein [Spirosoma aerophilum]
MITVPYTINDIKADSTLFSEPRKLVDLTDETLSESSGLALSHRNAGCLWTEQDSGNSNQIQLLNQDGSVVARFTLDGLENRDWEDIAVGPGPIPGESYIYLGEIGDNRRRNPEKIIYRFLEPTISGRQLPVDGHISTIDAIRLQLPDGPQNSEAFLIDPTTKDLFIFSKSDKTTLYRAPYPQSVTRTTLMVRQLIIPFERITSSAISTDGSEILMRNYTQLFYYKRQPGESITKALTRRPRLVPLAKEAQGEAVGWAPDGSGYYTTSEETFDTTPALSYYGRKGYGRP